MKTTTAFAFLSLALSCAAAAQAVTFDWATVGNAGNAADPETGYGAVSYNYAISTTEVTNAQYAEFLNAVAASDPNGLYKTQMGSDTWGGITRRSSAGSYTYSVKADALGQGPGGADGDDYTFANKPVVWVSFFDAMRFVNWLHNGQETGDTETGVYNISDGVSETRSANAKYWIPSEDEWYKAAYHDATAGTAGVYFDYPTSTDLVPDNNLPSADTGNSANFYDSGWTTGNSAYPMTDVGAYGLSESPYGTFDQGGNVWEWNEAVVSSSFRLLRGGSWTDFSSNLRADDRYSHYPTNGDHSVGFRVASIPEPSAMLLGAMASVGLLLRRRRYDHHVLAGCLLEK